MPIKKLFLKLVNSYNYPKDRLEWCEFFKKE